MKHRIIATRYAEAFVRYAQPAVGLPRVVEDIQVLRGALDTVPELREFLEGPEVRPANKAGFLDKVFGGVLSAEAMDFVKYLILKRRIDCLTDIADYILAVYLNGKTVEVHLGSVFPIAPEMAERIRAMLALRIGKDVKLYHETDLGLLGGVRIAIGNTVIDASIRNRLDELKKQLLKAQVA